MRGSMRFIGVTLVVAASVSVIACSPTGGKTETDASAPSAQSVQRYDLKGIVVSLDKSQPSVTVNHEEIKGFMSAMTMAYSVKDPKALDAVAKGDVVTAKLVSTGESYWLEDVKVVEHAKN